MTDAEGYWQATGRLKGNGANGHGASEALPLWHTPVGNPDDNPATATDGRRRGVSGFPPWTACAMASDLKFTPDVARDVTTSRWKCVKAGMALDGHYRRLQPTGIDAC